MTLNERASRKVEKILQEHKPDLLPEITIAQLNEIVERSKIK